MLTIGWFEQPCPCKVETSNLNPRSYRTIGTSMGPGLSGCLHCDVPLPRYSSTPVGWLPPSLTNNDMPQDGADKTNRDGSITIESCSDTTTVTLPYKGEPASPVVDKGVGVGCGPEDGLLLDLPYCPASGHQTVCTFNSCYNSCSPTSGEENEVNEYTLMNMLAVQQQNGAKHKYGSSSQHQCRRSVTTPDMYSLHVASCSNPVPGHVARSNQHVPTCGNPGSRHAHVTRSSSNVRREAWSAADERAARASWYGQLPDNCVQKSLTHQSLLKSQAPHSQALHSQAPHSQANHCGKSSQAHHCEQTSQASFNLPCVLYSQAPHRKSPGTSTELPHMRIPGCHSDSVSQAQPAEKVTDRAREARRYMDAYALVEMQHLNAQRDADASHNLAGEVKLSSCQKHSSKQPPHEWHIYDEVYIPSSLVKSKKKSKNKDSIKKLSKGGKKQGSAVSNVLAAEQDHSSSANSSRSSSPLCYVQPPHLPASDHQHGAVPAQSASQTIASSPPSTQYLIQAAAVSNSHGVVCRLSDASYVVSGDQHPQQALNQPCCHHLHHVASSGSILSRRNSPHTITSSISSVSRSQSSSPCLVAAAACSSGDSSSCNNGTIRPDHQRSISPVPPECPASEALVSHRSAQGCVCRKSSDSSSRSVSPATSEQNKSHHSCEQ